MFNLGNKIAAITGGMGQLGVTYAIALAGQGVSVALLDIVDTPKIKNPIYDDFVEEGLIRPYVVNIIDREALDSIFNEIKVEFGIPDILINNAALDSPPDAPIEEVGPFETYPESSYDKVMDVNVKGTV
ncbi:MAG: SDR family oxidoreductase, partial [Candidatus Electrothrix sp. ATG2]|nr:SDR family oxidoreductase [Candidatus Electrothrix sp. ATG2]